MLPCKKTVTNPYAARYIKRAQHLATAFGGSLGSKREVLDGCILEGKSLGIVASATVIEPVSRIYNAVHNYGTTFNTYVDRLGWFSHDGGTREPYCPGFGLNGLIDPSVESHRNHSYQQFSIGRPIAAEDHQGFDVYLNMKTPAYGNASEQYIYLPDYIYDTTASGQKYLRVLAQKTSAGTPGLFDGFVLHIHEPQISAFSGDYKISTLAYWARRSRVVEVSRGKLIIVAVVGKVIDTLPPTDPERPETSTTIWRESLVRLDVDLKLDENDAKRRELGPEYDVNVDRIPPEMTGSLFPEYLLPTDLVPGEILRYGPEENGVAPVLTVPAKTAMTIYDMELDADGALVVAVGYQVKVQESVGPERPSADSSPGEEGTTVIAYGLTSWGGVSSYFDIKEREVITSDGASALVSSHGADADFAALTGSVSIIDGKFVRCAALVTRQSLGYLYYNTNPSYAFHDPYFVEIWDGEHRPRAAGEAVMGIAYGGRGLGYSYGFSVDFERDFYLHSNWVRDVNNGNKAMVSEAAIAVPASTDIEAIQPWFIRSSGQGIMFIDGERRRYEPIASFPSNAEAQYITVTCHQKEVRDEYGVLVHPCVLLVGAIIDGEYMLCVRKGPIWDTDFPPEKPYSFDEYWKAVPAINKSYVSYFYIGNPLMSGNYGEFFMQKKEVTP